MAANFERFRQKSRAELSSQDQVGRVKAVRGLLPFIDAFEPLQASVDEAAPDAKIHSFYSGVYKQFNTLLDSWQVRRPQRTASVHRPRVCSSMHARTAAAAEDALATRSRTLKDARLLSGRWRATRRSWARSSTSSAT